jgi:mannosyltransferase
MFRLRSGRFGDERPLPHVASQRRPCYALSVSSGSPVRAAVRVRLWNRARESLLAAQACVALLAAGLLSSVLMLVSLGRRPLWFDETVSVEAAKLPTGTLAHYLVTTESNMSLYHVLLHFWLQLGSSEAFARSLSVIFAIATLPLLYALTRRLFDTRTATIAVALLAANVAFVGHAREARGYPLAVLLVTASSLSLVAALQDGRRRDWALCAITSALAIYAHLFAAFAILAQLGSLVVIRHRIDPRRLSAAVAALALLLTPLAAALLVYRQGGQIDWLEAPRARQLPGLIEWFTDSRALTVLYFAAGLVALSAAYADWREHGRSPQFWRYVLLVAWLAFPPVAAFAISFAKPVYLYRYFLVSLPALVVLVAAGLARIGNARIVFAAVLAAVVLSTRTTAACTPGCKVRHDDWRGAATYIESRMRPGDGVIFDPKELRTAFARYTQAARRPRLLYPTRWPLQGGRAEGTGTLSAALDQARSKRRVWLVSWWLPEGDVPTLLGRARGRPVVREFAGNVKIRLYGASRSELASSGRVPDARSSAAVEAHVGEVAHE